MPYTFKYYNPDKTLRFQKQLKKIKCKGITKKGLSCKTETYFGIPYCWRHIKDFNLTIKKSNIAGKGLFAYSKVKNIVFKKEDVIVQCMCPKISLYESNRRYGEEGTGPYLTNVGNDREKLKDCAGYRDIFSMANTSHDPKIINAYAAADENDKLFLFASKNIKNGEEIIWDYGDEYNIENNHKTVYTRI